MALNLSLSSDALRFVVAGNAVAKQRPVVVKRHGKSVTFTPRKTKTYEAAVHGNAYEAMMKEKRKRFQGPVRVTIEAVFSNPKSGDLDNICKSICDGMNGVVYDDDQQIIELHASKSKGPVAQAVIIVEAA